MGEGPYPRPYVAGEFSNLNINVRRNLLSTETVLKMHFAFMESKNRGIRNRCN